MPMRIARLHLRLPWHSAGKPASTRLWTKLAPTCAHRDCCRSATVWGRLRNRPRGLAVQGAWYCHPDCQERALADALAEMRAGRGPDPPVAHRVPLGLLLLARQQITTEQLRAGLAAQQSAGQGRIGEWLEHLGYIHEEQVTAALARQWSCPVLRPSSAMDRRIGAQRVPEIPIQLLESSRMIPIEYVAPTATLHVAFGDGIDYSLLYAVEQMLACHTEPYLASPSWLREHLEALSHRRPREAVFGRIADTAEFIRIIRSYAARVSAVAIRLVPCRRYTWVRLDRPPRSAVNLLLEAVVA